MRPEIRKQVHEKYGGRCAYCGEQIEMKAMQVDHITPIFRNWNDEELARYNFTRGTDDFSNLHPACRVCNGWKSTYTVDQFRDEIGKQLARLRAYNSNYRFALKYALVEEKTAPIVFFFESTKEGEAE